MRRHDIALGYGSKWHLLRYLGYHRDALNRQLEQQAGIHLLSWLDSPFDCGQPLKDAEWKGLDFLSDDEPAKRAWLDFWPQTGNVPNWDAVGLAQNGERTEWLLVEAKAHVEELHSDCNAKEGDGLEAISRALDTVRRECGAKVPLGNWLSPYYQYCNRLTTLYFLMKHAVPARLVFVYFTGDQHPKGIWDCPRTPEDWAPPLDTVKWHIGLAGKSELGQHVHYVFLPMCPS